MNPLRLRLVLILGLLVMFLAIFVPMTMNEPTMQGAVIGAMTGSAFVAVIGYPFLGALASWMRRRPVSDPVRLDRHYRWIDAHVTGAGTSALGYLFGFGAAVLATSSKFSVLENSKWALLVVSCVAAILCLFIMMFAATSKIVLEKHFEKLKPQLIETTSSSMSPHHGPHQAQ